MSINVYKQIPFSSSYRKCLKANERSKLWFKQVKDAISPPSWPSFTTNTTAAATSDATVNNTTLTDDPAVSHDPKPFIFGTAIPLSYPLSDPALLQQAFGTAALSLRQQGADGIVIGGAGTGETVGDLKNAILGVRNAVGEDVPILVQGMDTLPEVRTGRIHSHILYDTLISTCIYFVQ